MGSTYSTIIFSCVTLGKLFHLCVTQFIYKMGMIGFTLTGNCWKDKIRDYCTKEAFNTGPSTRPVLWKCWLPFVLEFNSLFLTWLSTYLCCFSLSQLKSGTMVFYFISYSQQLRTHFPLWVFTKQLFTWLNKTPYTSMQRYPSPRKLFQIDC